MTIATLLMLAALILFMLAAGGVGVSGPRFHTGWAGAACAAAALVLVPLL